MAWPGGLSPDGRWWWNGYQWVPAAPPPSRPKDEVAIAALVTSLVFPLWPLSSIAGVVLGAVALRRLRRTGAGGRGEAIAGVVIGTVVLVITALVVAVILYFGHECRNGC